MKKRTYVGKALSDTEWLLEQWGFWRMDGMGVPSYRQQHLHRLRCSLSQQQHQHCIIHRKAHP